MIIIKLNGGLGNQMFQYAAGKRLAIKNNTELKLDLSEYQNSDYRTYRLNNFNITENIASQKEIDNFKKLNTIQKLIEKFKPDVKKKVISYKSYGFEKELLNLKGDFYLDGYWQNEKYFFDIKDKIVKEFSLKNPLSNKYTDLIRQIKKTNSVSVHIRRGDYITSKKFSKVYKLLDENYYQKTVSFITEKINNAKFFIFSDDIDWAEKYLSFLGSKIFISKIDDVKDYEEMALMSLCHHNIIANSSFSWWGTWLNQNPSKIVVGPKSWFKFCHDDRGIMPEGWIKL